METGAGSLLGVVLRPENLAVVVGVWVLLSTAKKVAPELFVKPIVVRLLPVFPLVLCVAALWLPGVRQAEMGIGEQVLLGLILGFAVGHVHKLMMQAGLGRDGRIAPRGNEILR